MKKRTLQESAARIIEQSGPIQKRTLSEGLARIIEESGASQKRKDVTTKLLSSKKMDRLKSGMLLMSDTTTVKDMYKKAGWTDKQLTAVPTMVESTKDGINR